jgi:hypothetical protein
MTRTEQVGNLWGARAAYWREVAIGCRVALDCVGAIVAEWQCEYAVMAAGHFGGAEHEVAPDRYPPPLPLEIRPRRSFDAYWGMGV